MNVLELSQRRAGLISQARAVIDAAEGRAMTQEETNQYDALMEQVNQMAETIQRSERQAELDRELQDASSQAHRPDLEGREQSAGPRDTPEYREMARRWFAGGLGSLRANEVRALQADADIYGGYLLAPLQMARDLIKAVDNLVFMRQWATVYSVQGAADGLGAVSLDNDPADPTWTSEILIGSEDSTMSFGGRELKPHPLAKYIKVTRKLLRKVPDAEALVRDRLAYKFGVVAENNYLNGSGAGQPLGIFTASAQGISTSRDVSTGNLTTSIMTDGLLEAKYTLNQAYWPRARWLFHSDGVKQIAKLKDGDGQYIWQPSVQAGQPERLLNFPVFMSAYAPNTFSTGLYVGMLGDFSYYWIADDLNLEIQRLDELYAATNQVGFIGRLESDGMPVLESAFVRVKLA